jgi:uncharacterized protein YegP (UPF0339 family)
VTKLLSGALAAALVVGLAGVGGPAPAQDKKGKDTKAAAVIEVNAGKDGKYRFTIRDAEGKYLAGNTVGFETREAALKAVDNLKAALANAKVAEAKK